MLCRSNKDKAFVISKIYSKPPIYNRRMSSDQLSNEVWHLILDYCECNFVSLKVLRRSCKFLAALGASHLFKEVHISFLSVSLAKLSAITEHATFRHYPRNLFFYTSPWCAFDSFGQYVDRVKSPRKCERFKTAEDLHNYNAPISALTEEQLEFHYGLYEHHRRDHLALGVKDARRFQVRIAQLDGLANAEVVKHDDLVRRGLEHETLVTEGFGYPSLSQGNVRAILSKGVWQISATLEGLSLRLNKRTKPGPALRSLSFDTYGVEFWNQVEDPDAADLLSSDPKLAGRRTRLITMQPVFTSLTKLSLQATWALGIRDSLTCPAQIAAGLAQFLNSAVCLKDLRLSLHNIDGIPNGTDPDLLLYLPRVRWPKLEKLSLGITSSEIDFLRLFRDHSSTLISLELYYC